jgi:hypothetical protein
VRTGFKADLSGLGFLAGCGAAVMRDVTPRV